MTLSGSFPGLLHCPSATYWWPPIPNQRANPELTGPNSRLTDKEGKVEKASVRGAGVSPGRMGEQLHATKRTVGAEAVANPTWPLSR